MNITKKELEALRKVIEEKSINESAILVHSKNNQECQCCKKTSDKISIDKNNGYFGHKEFCLWALDQLLLEDLVSLLSKLDNLSELKIDL